ncbi:hypothetical protein ACIQZG_23560 [Lysinibacillus sp. NPDC096418]|uniref:hypothetical protein n=1 Tax=Lysinibacillus sp. NPDC096418 TaxID=3364138 RepID=UPI003808B57E
MRVMKKVELMMRSLDTDKPFWDLYMEEWYEQFVTLKLEPKVSIVRTGIMK